uniref:Ig-like domain-containing protein n=1 Tax=Agathobacter sp. TaxID=2021311 RepID=UPI0040287E6B
MKTNVTKRLACAFLALAVMITTVFVQVEPAKAAEKYTYVYSSEAAETAYAGTEVKFPITLTKNQGVVALVTTAAPVDMTITVYNSNGVAMNWSDNPFSVSSTSSDWEYDSSNNVYVYGDVLDTMNPGDYYYGITFTQNTYFYLDIVQQNENVKISQSKATITKGFTKKLSVTGAKVKSWKSKNKKIAKVDKNGKVTGVKAGKTTVYATTTDGKKLTCKITVKANVYSVSKPTLSDAGYYSCIVEAYKGSFDKSGNLVINARIANNTPTRVVQLKDVKFVVKDANGKVIGTYKASKYNVSVSAYSTKDVKFTIKKSSLKKKKADLRNATITRKGGSYYYRY